MVGRHVVADYPVPAVKYRLLASPMRPEIEKRSHTATCLPLFALFYPNTALPEHAPLSSHTRFASCLVRGSSSTVAAVFQVSYHIFKSGEAVRYFHMALCEENVKFSVRIWYGPS